jgi:hypothetical protein
MGLIIVSSCEQLWITKSVISRSPKLKAMRNSYKKSKLNIKKLKNWDLYPSHQSYSKPRENLEDYAQVTFLANS